MIDETKRPLILSFSPWEKGRRCKGRGLLPLPWQEGSGEGSLTPVTAGSFAHINEVKSPLTLSLSPLGRGDAAVTGAACLLRKREQQRPFSRRARGAPNRSVENAKAFSWEKGRMRGSSTQPAAGGIAHD